MLAHDAGSPRHGGAALRTARVMLVAHAVLIAASIAAFGLIVDRPPPSWADPASWARSYAIGMQWTGPAYIVTGFVAALAAWIAVVGLRRGLISAGLVLLVSGGMELLGVATGFPFGAYGYGDTLGPKVFSLVPVVIPLSWFLVLFATLGVAARMGLSRGKAAAAAALGLLAWDVLMDPAMSAAFPFWSWHDGGVYFGMPLINWFGWLLTGAMIGVALLWSGVRTEAQWQAASERIRGTRIPDVLYLLNGLFPLALALQRDLFVAGVIGAAAMALFLAAPALLASMAAATPRPRRVTP